MRPAVDLDVPLALDPRVGAAVHRQLAEQLAAAVADGRLPRGARLPSTRTLAIRLCVSRGVVLAAYDELTARGFLEGRHGSGTYVAESLPTVLPAPRRPAPRPRDTDLRPPVADLTPGMPNLQALPDAAWRRAWWRARAWLDVDDEGRPSGGQGGRAGGSGALRSALAGHLAAARGLAVDPTEITVTAGSREGLALLALAVGVAGRDVVVEEPGYPNAVALFRRLGARVVPVPVDDEGLRTDLLPRGEQGRRVALVHVTPSHQYPLGGVLPLHRRTALLAWAAGHGAVVVEDDYDGEFRYEVPPLPALAALAEGAPVAYLGTFSKSLTPALRAGYLVAPGSLADAVDGARADLGAPVAAPVQQALAEYVGTRGLSRHVTRMRRTYARSRALVVGALVGVRGVVAVRGAHAGLHVVVETAAAQVAARVQEECGRRGVLVPTLAEYHVDPAAATVHGLVVGYAGEAPERLRTGLQVVVAALRQASNGPA